METIKTGKFVELAYEIFEVEGKEEALMYKYTPETPDKIIFGMENGMLEAFAKTLQGLKVGETFDITLTPEQAFGEYLDDHVMEFEREMFMADGEFDEERIKVGNAIEMMTAQGQRVPGDVLDVTDTMVKVDFNHPLAGQTIRFKGEVVTVRDATPEELQPQSCGCGSDHGCGDDCDNGGCGSGCSGCN